MSELERLIKTPSDINEHLSIMNKYAKECSHITEMGVRDIVSTWAWLEAKPKKLICYDIAKPPASRLEQVLDYVIANNIMFVFNIADVLKVKIEKTDLLFIDTVHTYAQLSNELSLHANKVIKYIVLHDTQHFGDVGVDAQGKNTEGLTKAVTEFLNKNPDWVIAEQFENCFGLTILKKTNNLVEE